MKAKPLRINRAALRELEAAAEWYDHQRAGLGEGFLAATREALVQITRFPQGAPAALGIPKRVEARSLRVPGFPYSVIYRDQPKEVRVFAFAHASRRPGYWRRR